jgi:carbamoyl-phosphate synthase large subunit
MIQCNIAVTGLNTADDPAPGLAVIRSIRESKEWEGRIIGLSYTALDTGIYNKGLLDEVYLLPNLFDGDGLWQRLKEITQKTKIDVLMPLLDLELLSLAAIEPSLGKIGIRLLLPNTSTIKMHYKLNLAGFCQRSNIKYPKQIAITSAAQIKPGIANLGTPVVVKGIVHESHLATSTEEALIYFNRIKTHWGLPVLLQEYIRGEEYNTDCLTDKEGRLIGAVAMRKLAITEKGKGWSGVTVKDERLLNLSKDILEKLGWIGPIELEFVKQRSSGSYYLLEINPRFGAWIYLAANAGQNLPLASIKIALGQKVEPLPPYKGGLMFVRQCLDSICPIEYLANLTAKGELILNEEKTRS